MRIQQETTNCEHETHQSLINNELMTVMDCRNCGEIGETNCPELRIHIPALFQGHCFVAKCEVMLSDIILLNDASEVPFTVLKAS